MSSLCPLVLSYALRLFLLSWGSSTLLWGPLDGPELCCVVTLSPWIPERCPVLPWVDMSLPYHHTLTLSYIFYYSVARSHLSSPVSAPEVDSTLSPSVLNQPLTQKSWSPNSCAPPLCCAVSRAGVAAELSCGSCCSPLLTGSLCVSVGLGPVVSADVSFVSLETQTTLAGRRKANKRTDVEGCFGAGCCTDRRASLPQCPPRLQASVRPGFRRKMRSTRVVFCFRTSPASTGHLALWGMPSLLLKGQIFPGDRAQSSARMQAPPWLGRASSELGISGDPSSEEPLSPAPGQ